MATTKERHAQLVRESQKRYPEKSRARRALRKKVIAGKIPHFSNFTCVDCGGKSECYDHAYGYDGNHRFKVDPVCWPCHRKRGKDRKEYKSGYNYGWKKTNLSRKIIICKFCGRENSVMPSNKAKFCSKECYNKYQRL